jgi:hypothetical protein
VRRSEARITRGSVWCVALTGFAYGGLLYFGETEDEFGPVAHPWLPAMHTLHVLLVPWFVFAFGMLWQNHIIAKLRSAAHARRKTGIVLLPLTITMIATGYLVQVSVDETWRCAWQWGHGVSSVLFVIVFGLHLMARCASAARRTS